MIQTKTKPKRSQWTSTAAKAWIVSFGILVLSACGQDVKFKTLEDAATEASRSLYPDDFQSGTEFTQGLAEGTPELVDESPEMAGPEQPVDSPEAITLFSWKPIYKDTKGECHICNIKKCLIDAVDSCNSITEKKTMRCRVPDTKDDHYVYVCKAITVQN